MKKPWIGIPARYHEKSQYIGQLRHYLDAILWAGGIPLLIPVGTADDVLQSYTERINGVLLPGSPTDIDPKMYGADAHPKLGKLFPERDRVDLELLDYSEKNNKPLLGICFGVQSLNVYRGGSLVQDIPSVITNPVAHDTSDNSDTPSSPARHLVRLSPESVISRLAGKTEVMVNSYHHQAVENTGRNLRPVAVAPDGVVEAIEDTRGRFIVGVQWHPERGFETDPLSQALFKSLVEAAML